MRNRVLDLPRTIFGLAVAGCFVISAASVLAISAPMNTCVNNLRQIDSAIQVWALENGVSDTNSCSLTNSKILAHLSGKALPPCPEGGTYTAGQTITNWPECSIHGNPDTAWSIRERRIQEEKRQTIQIAVSLLIAGAVCIGTCLLFRRKRRHRIEIVNQ